MTLGALNEALCWLAAHRGDVIFSDDGQVVYVHAAYARRSDMRMDPSIDSSASDEISHQVKVEGRDVVRAILKAITELRQSY
jgi:hypothetical protein